MENKDILELSLELFENLEKVLFKILKRDFEKPHEFLKEIEKLYTDFLKLNEYLEKIEKENSKVSLDKEKLRLLKEKQLKINILSENINNLIQKEIKFFERETKKHKASIISKEV